MHVLFLVYIAILFVIFSPGVLFKLPSKGSQSAVLFVHTCIFIAVLYFSQSLVYNITITMEGLAGAPACLSPAIDSANQISNQSQANLTTLTNTLNGIVTQLNAQVAQLITIANSLGPNSPINTLPVAVSQLSQTSNSIISDTSNQINYMLTSNLSQLTNDLLRYVPSNQASNIQTLVNGFSNNIRSQIMSMFNASMKQNSSVFDGFFTKLDSVSKQYADYSTQLNKIQSDLAAALAQLQNLNKSQTPSTNLQISSNMTQLIGQMQSCAQ